jgi:hypothetical protein
MPSSRELSAGASTTEGIIEKRNRRNFAVVAEKFSIQGCTKPRRTA